jgi:hypothetical protein
VGSADKILSGMRQSLLDCTLADFQVVARAKGIGCRHRGAGHCVFVRSDGRTLPVPACRPIKPIYVKLFLALIDGDA